MRLACSEFSHHCQCDTTLEKISALHRSPFLLPLLGFRSQRGAPTNGSRDPSRLICLVECQDASGMDGWHKSPANREFAPSITKETRFPGSFRTALGS